MNTEARSSIDNLLTTLKESLAQPGKSLLPLLTTMSRFAKYSLANQFLIFAQRPDATCVMGYRTWNKAGYQVRKGEHGIAIYAPMRFAQRDSGALDDGATASPRLGFRVAYVFDVAQVDALAGTDAARSPRHPPTPDAHRAPRGAQGLPRRPQRRARVQGARTRPARLHQRPPHHLRSRPGRTRRVRDARPRDHARAAALPAPTAALAPTSSPARPKPKRSPTCSARSSASRVPKPQSSTSSPTAARPTRWTRRSSASAPPRSGSPSNLMRFASTWSPIPSPA